MVTAWRIKALADCPATELWLWFIIRGNRRVSCTLRKMFIGDSTVVQSHFSYGHFLFVTKCIWLV